MRVSIKGLDKILLCFKLYNHIQENTSFGSAENAFKSLDDAKKFFAENRNDYACFNLYCDITQDDVDTDVFDVLYGNGKTVFETIVEGLKEEVKKKIEESTSKSMLFTSTAVGMIPSTVISAGAGVETTNATATSASGSIVLDTKNLNDLLQQQAEKLKNKLTEMAEDRRKPLPRKLWAGASLEAVNSYDNKVKDIKKHETLAIVAENIGKNGSISDVDRASLLDYKKALETYSAHPSRTAVMVGELLATLDKLPKVTIAPAKP